MRLVTLIRGANMKQSDDDRTLDMLDPFKRGRGRPVGHVPGLSAAQRQALRRARLAKEGRGVLTVELSLDVLKALDDFLRFKDETKGSAVERILRDRLLRKR